MQNTSRRLPVLWFFAALAGCGLMLTALLTIVLAFVLSEAVLGSYAPILAGFGLIGSMLGIGLLVVGIRGWQAKPPVPINTRWGWLILLLLLIVLGGFALAIPVDLQSTPIFAPIHFGMIMLPILSGLLIVIRLSGVQLIPTFREVVVALTGGASSVMLALPFEIMGVILVVGLVFAGASILPAGQAEVARLLSLIQLWAEVPPSDLGSVLSIATSPVVVLSFILILACLTPLIEEFVKTLVMGVMGIWVRPGLGKAFIWGLSCGLGFAAVEGISNGSVGLVGGGWWLGSIVARLLASMMHALTSGLLGLGWGSLWERKWWRLPLFYALAVTLHGLWNLSVILLVIGGIVSTTEIWLGLVLALLGGGMLFAVFLSVAGALIAIPLFLRNQRRAGRVPVAPPTPRLNPVQY